MTSNWLCERCTRRGTVAYAAHAGVWDVLTAIAAAHRTASPTCDQHTTNLRVSLGADDADDPRDA